ncbi:MAG: hypothetical protein H7Y42_13945 [Chitinophagaceae bacterium]|nr:hypothetical protein [Chitinophagaceae bacterium]
MTTHKEVIQMTADGMLDGKGRTELRAKIRREPAFEYSNDDECDTIIAQAKALLESTTSLDPRDIISNHILIYEEIFFYARSIGDAGLADKALKAKERLIGLTNQSRVMINKKTNITVHAPVQYDWTRLSSEEYQRMQELTAKATPVPEVGQILQIESNQPQDL